MDDPTVQLSLFAGMEPASQNGAGGGGGEVDHGGGGGEDEDDFDGDLSDASDDSWVTELRAVGLDNAAAATDSGSTTDGGGGSSGGGSSVDGGSSWQANLLNRASGSDLDTSPLDAVRIPITLTRITLTEAVPYAEVDPALIAAANAAVPVDTFLSRKVERFSFRCGVSLSLSSLLSFSLSLCLPSYSLFALI